MKIINEWISKFTQKFTDDILCNAKSTDKNNQVDKNASSYISKYVLNIVHERVRVKLYEVIYPLRVSSTLVPDRHVYLLLFERDGVQHYTTIRNFTILVGRQLGNHGRHAIHCCRWCLHAYSSQELLDAHALDCFHTRRTKFLKDARCRFTNIQKQLLAPFVVYADFESILQQVGDEAMDTTQGVAAGGYELTPAGPF